MAVHGEDVTLCGLDEDLEWIAGVMGGWFNMKIRGVVGGDPNDVKEMTILGRLLRYTDDGIEFVGDPKTPKAAFRGFRFRFRPLEQRFGT